MLLSSKITIILKPLHLNIVIHILHTLLYTFPLVLTRRICLTIKRNPPRLVIISFSLVILMNNLAALPKGELRCRSLSGLKALVYLS